MFLKQIPSRPWIGKQKGGLEMRSKFKKMVIIIWAVVVVVVGVFVGLLIFGLGDNEQNYPVR